MLPLCVTISFHGCIYAKVADVSLHFIWLYAVYVHVLVRTLIWATFVSLKSSQRGPTLRLCSHHSGYLCVRVCECMTSDRKSPYLTAFDLLSPNHKD